MRAISMTMVLALVACGAEAPMTTTSDDGLELEAARAADLEGKADAVAARFRTLTFDLPAGRGTRETRRLFTSAASFRSYFGVAPPAGVSFAAERLFFYSAGQQATDGYRAQVASMLTDASGRTLVISTVLHTPDADCVPRDRATVPNVLVAFTLPAGVRSTRYASRDAADGCGTCAGPGLTVPTYGDRCCDGLELVGNTCNTPVRCAGPGLTVPTYGARCCDGLVLVGNTCNRPLIFRPTN